MTSSHQWASDHGSRQSKHTSLSWLIREVWASVGKPDGRFRPLCSGVSPPRVGCSEAMMAAVEWLGDLLDRVAEVMGRLEHALVAAGIAGLASAGITALVSTGGVAVAAVGAGAFLVTL